MFLFFFCSPLGIRLIILFPCLSVLRSQSSSGLEPNPSRSGRSSLPSGPSPVANILGLIHPVQCQQFKRAQFVFLSASIRVILLWVARSRFSTWVPSKGLNMWGFQSWCCRDGTVLRPWGCAGTLPRSETTLVQSGSAITYCTLIIHKIKQAWIKPYTSFKSQSHKNENS